MPDSLGVERLWQLTAEHSPVGMTLVSPDGVIADRQPRALRSCWGTTEDELKGSRYELLTHPDDRPRHVAPVRRDRLRRAGQLPADQALPALGRLGAVGRPSGAVLRSRVRRDAASSAS